MKRKTKNEIDALELRLRIINKKYYIEKLRLQKLSKERQLLKKRLDYYEKRRALERINK